MRHGSKCIDHNTASAVQTHGLHKEAADCGIGVQDVLVSGGQSCAGRGTFAKVADGAEGEFAGEEPVLVGRAGASRIPGPAGREQPARMVDRICLEGSIPGLAEDVHRAEHTVPEQGAVMSVIDKGISFSGQMRNRTAPTARGEFHFGYAIDTVRKDPNCCQGEAKRMGARLRATVRADRFHIATRASTAGRWDV